LTGCSMDTFGDAPDGGGGLVAQPSTNNEYRTKTARIGPRKLRAAASMRNVFVLDDDAAEAEAIRTLLGGQKFLCTAYTDPKQCLDDLRTRMCDILLCDLIMPEMDGMEVLTQAREIRPGLPVIMVTGHGNVAAAVTAVKKGASHFIEKPFDGQVLLDAISDALSDADREWSEVAVELSKMEKVILKHIIQGHGNKHIAFMIGRSVRTVEDHRSHLMKKLGVDNVVDLVKRCIAMKLV